MGVMLPETQLCVTPHPVTLEGQRHMVAAMEDREKLGAFLARTVPEWDRDCWEVRINGQVVPHEILDCVRPKDGTLIEVRGAVKKQALYIIAFAALTYFTFGIGAAAGGTLATGAGIAGVVGGMGGMLLATAVFVAGSVLINKVLGPKVGKAGGDREQGEVYRLGAARNRARPYEPVGLLFGKVRIAPDYISQPYTWYEADQQFLSLILTPGINVHHVEDLYNGDALLSAYHPELWYSGFSGMPEQKIPFYSNADQVTGGSLDAQGKHQPGPWVQRTTSDNTVTIQVDVEYQLYDFDSKGRPHPNQERFEVQYRAVGSVSWQSLGNYHVVSRDTKVKRLTFSRNVPEGAYDVRVRIAGLNNPGQNANATFAWTTLKSIQPDNATYQGISRIGIKLMATGQLNGAPDEIRCVAVAEPIPVWKGAQWVTERTSNPGAQILAYARGIHSGGQRVAGMGMPDHKIDIPALQAFMLHCAANGYTYDYWLTEPRNHEEVLNSIARAGFGQITRANGKLSIVWAADEQPLSGVVNMATIKKGSFQVDYTFANAADGIEATWFDAEAWETKTLRVPAPGVTTMLGPAQLQLEGVTNEAHAAQLARWHLAQSLYQYKDISYSTDLEHLAYRRLSVLALQHDLTQWGFGGRVVSAAVEGGAVTLTLDEPVPASAQGNAFIGLRIPGERVYRVFGVVPFTGQSDTLTLTGTWPADAALPGDSGGNPEHDTIWIYDFKQTPGLRCRVVQIEPESDLKGARVAVVPESAEFWDYVNTGHYVPSPSGSLLNTRPIVRNLKVSEGAVVQGDTVFTELSALWTIEGAASESVVSMASTDGVLVEVARVRGQSASWRISGPGTYTISVRPIGHDGLDGRAASITFTTVGAGALPVLVDLFDVQERSGGVRLYTWGWFNEPPPDYVPPETPPGIEPQEWHPTTRSPDFAGVEIRYIEGEIPAPSWEEMTPVGESGYHTAPFEAVVPAAGVWTFAIRSRNTSGDLSEDMRVIVRTLAANLGQVIEAQNERIGSVEMLAGQMLDEFGQVTERVDAIVGQIDEAVAAADEAKEQAAAALAAGQLSAEQLRSEMDVLAGQLGDILKADEWVGDRPYPSGDIVQSGGKLYRALMDVPAGTPVTNTAYWDPMGEYDSLGAAVAANLRQTIAQATAIDANVQSLNLLGARNAGNTAFVLNETTVRVDAATTLAQWRSSLQSSFAGVNGRIDSEAAARATADAAQVQRIGTMEARMPAGTGGLATQASLTSVDTASVDRDAAQVQRIGTMEARMPAGNGPLATNSELVASINTVFQAAVNGDAAQALRIDALQARMPAGDGTLATTASVDSVFQAAVAGDSALALRADALEARMPAGNGKLATSASVDSVSQARADGDAALALRADAIQATAGEANTKATQALTASGTAVAAATRVEAALGQSSDNLIKQSTFSAGSLGQWSGASSVGVAASSIPGGGETAVMRVTTGGSYEVGNEFPVGAGEQFDVSFVSNGSARVGLHFLAANGSTTGWEGPARSSSGFTETSARITAPAGTNRARPWATALSGTGDITRLRIARVTTAEKQLASVTQSLEASVGNLNGWANAKYSLVLNAGGDVAGMQLFAGGGVSAVRFMSSSFSVVNPNGTAGLQWTNGNLWSSRGSFTFLTGPDLGENMMVYIGPTPSSPGAAQKANAIFYVDTAGVGYFAGQVLSGIIRAFNSSTEVNTNNTTVYVAADPISSNNKQVAVTARFQRQSTQDYPSFSSQITLASGTTQARVQIQRRYGNGGWVTIGGPQTIYGSVTVLNENDGPSTITWRISGDLMATDVADTRQRQYRVMIDQFSLQQHTVTNPGTIPARVHNQYQSIESME